MKVYHIDSPEKLREAADMIKWERDRRRALAVADLWENGSDVPEAVTLEVSRNAHLFTKDAGKKSLLATMYVTGAREFVKGLEEDRT